LENLISGGIKIWREEAGTVADDSYLENDRDNLPPQGSWRYWLQQLRTLYLAPLIYLILGLFLFTSLFMIVNTHLLQMKIETAVVSVPIEPVVSPMSGFIAEIYVNPGMYVKKGRPLVRIENVDLQRDLLLARVQAEDSQLHIHYLQTLRINELQRLNVYKDVGASRVSSAQTRVNRAKEEVLVTEKNLARIRTLHKKHYISDAEFDLAFANYHTAAEGLKEAIAQNALERSSLNAVNSGIYFTGNKLEGVEKDLNAEIEAAQRRLLLNQQKVKIYEDLANKLIPAAPYNGTVTQILKTAGNTTDTLKPLILLEQEDSKKQIIAYLTQAEITHVRASDRVKVYLPALGKTYLGKVADINRTAGFVDEVKAQYRWRDMQVDRSAMVIIDIDKNTQGFHQAALAGMPALVYFKRKFTFF